MINLPFGNSALIISKTNPNKLIAVSRRENPNLICFPGGKQELNESSVEGLVREVYEETGLQFSINEATPIYSGVCEGEKEYWVTAYLIVMDDEITEFNPPEKDMFPQWISKNEFMQKTSYPNFNAKVFEAVEKWI
jgi:8-oxo-dGTP pyrophosphatase MutT (NUDIX family)